MSESIEDLQDRIIEQLHAGEEIDREAILRRHPQHQDALLNLFELLDNVEGPPVLPDASIEDFRIVRELGRGGMGIVYEARQLRPERRVALKILPKSLSRDPRLARRFQREALAAARLRHPNVVPVLAVSRPPSPLFYVMELIAGPSLAQVIERRQEGDHAGLPAPGPEYRRWAVQTIAQVADALHDAHQHGVIHRDVKPGNILLDEAGRPRLADFGLALQLDASALTRSGELFGSPLYMSPEQAIHQRKPIDERTDVYSLAVTLYELLTLQVPYRETSGPRLFHELNQSRRVPPRRHDAGISRPLEATLMQAMARDPEARPRSAAEFAANLRNALRGIAPGRRRLRLRRVGLRAAGVALAALVVLVVALLVMRRAAHEARQAALVAEMEARLAAGSAPSSRDGTVPERNRTEAVEPAEEVLPPVQRPLPLDALSQDLPATEVPAPRQPTAEQPVPEAPPREVDDVAVPEEPAEPREEPGDAPARRASPFETGAKGPPIPEAAPLTLAQILERLPAADGEEREALADELVTFLHPKNQRDNVRVIEALAELPDGAGWSRMLARLPAAVPATRRLLHEHLVAGGADVLPLLLELRLAHPDNPHLAAVAWAQPEAALALAEQRLNQLEPDGLAEGCWLVECVGPPLGHRHQARVRELLKDRSPEVRIAACQALGSLGSVATSSLRMVTDLAASRHRDTPGRQAALRAARRIMTTAMNPRGPSTSRSRRAQLAINRALVWLTDHQDPRGGFWDCDEFSLLDSPLGRKGDRGRPGNDVGVTGLALRALLKNRTRGTHEWDDAITAGLQYLLDRQRPSGDFGGITPDNQHGIYRHLAATEAVLDAARQLPDPRLRDAAARAVQCLQKVQAAPGGWRYEARAADADTSVTTWALLVLKEALRAGIDVDLGAIQRALRLMHNATDSQSQLLGYDLVPRGGYSHLPAREADRAAQFPADQSLSTTAMGLLVYQVFPVDLTDEAYASTSRHLLGLLPLWDRDRGCIDLTYWYYGTRALYPQSGAPFSRWNAALDKALLDSQRDDADPAYRGSWDPVGVWGNHGGRIYATAMATLTLQVRLGQERMYAPAQRPGSRTRSALTALRRLATQDEQLGPEAARVVRQVELAR